jgi:hypothetical protein
MNTIKQMIQEGMDREFIEKEFELLIIKVSKV